MAILTIVFCGTSPRLIDHGFRLYLGWGFHSLQLFRSKHNQQRRGITMCKCTNNFEQYCMSTILRPEKKYKALGFQERKGRVTWTGALEENLLRQRWEPRTNSAHTQGPGIKPGVTLEHMGVLTQIPLTTPNHKTRFCYVQVVMTERGQFATHSLRLLHVGHWKSIITIHLLLLLLLLIHSPLLTLNCLICNRIAFLNAYSFRGTSLSLRIQIMKTMLTLAAIIVSIKTYIEVADPVSWQVKLFLR